MMVSGEKLFALFGCEDDEGGGESGCGGCGGVWFSWDSCAGGGEGGEFGGFLKGGRFGDWGLGSGKLFSMG